MKLGEIVLDGKNGPDYAVIYIIRDSDVILYVGKSQYVELRLAQHLGYANPPSSGYFDEAARASIPACWDWDVEFITVPAEYLTIEMQASIDYWIRNKEARLIRLLHPKYNIQYNVD